MTLSICNPECPLILGEAKDPCQSSQVDALPGIPASGPSGSLGDLAPAPRNSQIASLRVSQTISDHVGVVGNRNFRVY